MKYLSILLVFIPVTIYGKFAGFSDSVLFICSGSLQRLQIERFRLRGIHLEKSLRGEVKPEAEELVGQGLLPGEAPAPDPKTEAVMDEIRAEALERAREAEKLEKLSEPEVTE